MHTVIDFQSGTTWHDASGRRAKEFWRKAPPSLVTTLFATYHKSCRRTVRSAPRSNCCSSCASRSQTGRSRVTTSRASKSPVSRAVPGDVEVQKFGGTGDAQSRVSTQCSERVHGMTNDICLKPMTIIVHADMSHLYAYSLAGQCISEAFGVDLDNEADSKAFSINDSLTSVLDKYAASDAGVRNDSSAVSQRGPAPRRLDGALML